MTRKRKPATPPATQDTSSSQKGAGPVRAAPRKIAILGCAQTSVNLAPWADTSYEIWGCSGALQPLLKRYDAFFELHDLASCLPLWTPEYVAFLESSTKPIYLTETHPEIPASVAFPRDDLIAKFGDLFFTSSIAWMLAYALEQDPEEIGLWGVDMLGDTEYVEQRAGCHHFITAARHRGIRITAPPESAILNPPPLYGCAPRNPRTVQTIAIARKLETELQTAQQGYEGAAFHKKYLEGYNDCFKQHVLKNLEQDPKSVAGG